MAWFSVCPAMPAPNVPARGLVKIVTEGRWALVGITALSPYSRKFDENVGGITNSPYACARSSSRLASSCETTRMSNLSLSSAEPGPSTIFGPAVPASSFTTAIGK